MNNLTDRLNAVKLKAQQQKRRRRMEIRNAARREDAIHNVRCREIGKIVCEDFPKLLRYQPQYGNAVSDAVYDEFVAVVNFLASHRELLDRIRAEAFDGNPRCPGSKDST